MGIYAPDGSLYATLNDPDFKGVQMPDGSLRVTDTPGLGIYDNTGAWRILTAAGNGAYAPNGQALRYSDASSDGFKGSTSPSGAMRLTFIVEFYVAENGTDFYVTENGLNNYIAG